MTPTHTQKKKRERENDRCDGSDNVVGKLNNTIAELKS